jgi:CheY-like chemotaxis protein
VLVIDDESAVRMALRTILQSDYDILEADSAEKGLEILKKQRADLITLDVLMPGESGLDTLRHIRASDECGHLPVIMITGHASVDSACEALRLGATDYLQKPFGVDELKTSIRQGLSHSRFHPAPKEKEEPQVGGMQDEELVRLGKASAAFVHDLASPLQVLTILNTLCGQKLNCLPASPERDNELREVVGQMDRLISWATELAKGWQTIAVPSALTRETIGVEPLLKQVVEVVTPYARLNSVEVTCQHVGSEMTVFGDRVQVERALVNLCLNGIKASISRGRTLEISARTFQNHLVFRFVDSGQGFTPERMKEVLQGDPFKTSTKKRRGLGLFIADWIAVNHGGKLQFICEEGVGTTVELFLPQHKQAT